MKEEKFHPSFKNIGLSKIVEISEKARDISPEYTRKTGKPFIPFQRGELGFNTPDYIKRGIQEALEKGMTKYPKSGGEPWFKDAVIEHLREMRIRGIERENVICTYGGQGGLQLTFSLFGKTRGAGFGPCWSCILGNIIPYSQVDFTLIPLEGEEFKINYQKLEEVLRNVDLFYLNNPHNPTGKVFSREELERINHLCQKNDVITVSDEAYKDIVFYGEKHISMLEFDAYNVISVFTFSKSFAATGCRIGYTVTRNEKIIERITLADYTQTAGVVPFIQYAFKVALENKKERDEWLNYFIGELEKRRNITYQGLNEVFSRVYKPGGSFYFFIDLNKYIPENIKDKDKYLLDIFLNNGVAVVTGSSFGKEFEGFIRLSFSALNEELIKEGIERIAEIIGK